jgi:hypothetical protein
MLIPGQALRTKLLAVIHLATLVWLSSQSAFADLLVLYDGAGLPVNQVWMSFAELGVSQQTPVSGGVRLQTDAGGRAGYSNYLSPTVLKNAAFPSLSANAGFELSFSLTVNTENHSSPNRAGFSTTLLGNDRKGIELGFWEDEIWAQSSTPTLFNRAESVAIDTTVRRDYRLQIRNNTYTLFVGANTLLSGEVRDYSSFGIPYNQANFLFFGDNTTSAEADITLGRIALQSDLTAVPEPSSLVLLACSILTACMWIRKRSD